MTCKRVQTAAAAALTVLALAAPLAARAGVVLVSDPAVAAPVASTVSTVSVSETVALSIEAARIELESPASAFALSEVAHRKVFDVLRGASDAALWNLVATVHAQQKAKTFDLVTTSVKTVWEIEKSQVSAVPLPGVVWLFVMAVLGIVGNRSRKPAPQADEAGPSAGAAPLPA